MTMKILNIFMNLLKNDNNNNENDNTILPIVKFEAEKINVLYYNYIMVHYILTLYSNILFIINRITLMKQLKLKVIRILSNYFYIIKISIEN